MSHEPLRQAREDANISLPRMADIIGMDKGNLSKVENGKASPSTIERVAYRYQVALGITDHRLVRQCGTLPANLSKLLDRTIPGQLRRLATITLHTTGRGTKVPYPACSLAVA